MRYLISFNYISMEKGPGSGTITDYRPTTAKGQPCTLMASHIAGIRERVAKTLPGGGSVTITYIWKYE
jgi:hypothetical protein